MVCPGWSWIVARSPTWDDMRYSSFAMAFVAINLRGIDSGNFVAKSTTTKINSCPCHQVHGYAFKRGLYNWERDKRVTVCSLRSSGLAGVTRSAILCDRLSNPQPKEMPSHPFGGLLLGEVTPSTYVWAMCNTTSLYERGTINSSCSAPLSLATFRADTPPIYPLHPPHSPPKVGVPVLGSSELAH